MDKKPIPKELQALDLMLCQKLEAEKAPPKVFEKWQEFLDAVIEWKG